MPNKTSRIMNSKGGLSGFHKLVSGHPQGLLVAVHFWADWAEQCAPMDEVIKILSQDDEFNQVLFVRVEAEEEAEVAMEYEVAAVPTFIFFGRVSDGKKIRVIDRIEGAKVADVTKKVKELSSKLKLEHRTAILNEKNAALDVAEKQESSEDLNTRLKRLINAAPAMLFMKGSPAAPECGFSRQTVQMLNEINAEYGHFDILRDQEVRQGLKEYSKWPTYPQLYVKGELIGGLDILKEMHENGELESLLPKKQNLNERLGFLVNQSPVMIFMKGDRSEPKCGFSRQLVEMMKEYPKVNYKTFDILKDEEVRQGLKTFSNWPTYPQVYVKGKLIGGLDIIKELKEEDELESTLTG